MPLLQPAVLLCRRPPYRRRLIARRPRPLPARFDCSPLVLQVFCLAPPGHRHLVVLCSPESLELLLPLGATQAVQAPIFFLTRNWTTPCTRAGQRVPPL